MDSLMSTFFIGKVSDKYYVYEIQAMFGGVTFANAEGPFHTSEDAHLWLIEKAKDMTDESQIMKCVEIERQFIFIKSAVVSS